MVDREPGWRVVHVGAEVVVEQQLGADGRWWLAASCRRDPGGLLSDSWRSRSGGSDVGLLWDSRPYALADLALRSLRLLGRVGDESPDPPVAEDVEVDTLLLERCRYEIERLG